MKYDQTFLFQGDSITDGGRGRGGDPNHRLGKGYVYNIASRLMAEYPIEKPHFYNRGVGGDTSSQMLARWQEDALDINPDVLSVLIGVNDCARISMADGGMTTDLVLYERNVRTALTLSREQNPNLSIIIGLPFYYVMPEGELDKRFHTKGDAMEQEFILNFRKCTQEYREEKLRAIEAIRGILRRIAVDFSAKMIDCDGILKGACAFAPIWYWCSDGAHPTEAGHYLLAQEWLKALPL